MVDSILVTIVSVALVIFCAFYCVLIIDKVNEDIGNKKCLARIYWGTFTNNLIAM